MHKIILSTVISSFFLIGTAHAGDPVPGLDVSLEQIPGGTSRSEAHCRSQGGKVVYKDGKTFCALPKAKPKYKKQRGALPTLLKYKLAEKKISITADKIGGYIVLADNTKKTTPGKKKSDVDHNSSRSNFSQKHKGSGDGNTGAGNAATTKNKASTDKK